MAAPVGYERAARAVIEFRRMLPTLTGFVRALARKPVSVEIAATTYTDGNTVYLRAPLALADTRAHDRGRCGQRDDDGALVCAACSASEDVFSDIYHETAHILHGSFADVDRDDLEEALVAGSLVGSPEYQKRVRRAGERIEDPLPILVAGDVHAYVHAMLLGVEDVRVDTAAGVARPGVEKMRYAGMEVILNRGIELDDGTYERWIDRELEHQVSIAIMAEMHGHALDGRFSDPVIDAVRHPEVVALLDDAVLETVLDAVRLSVALVGILERLGVFTLDDEDGAGGEGDERPFAMTFGGRGDDVAEGAVQAMLMATGHDHDDDEVEVDDDTVESAIEQTKNFDEYTAGTTAQIIYRGRGPAYEPWPRIFGPRSSVAPHVSIPDASLGQSVMRARRMFSASRLDGIETGLRSGKLDPALLGRRAPLGDGRLFRHRTRAEGIDWEVVIGLDVSGSTDDRNVISLIRQLGEAMANVLHRVGVRFTVYAHSTNAVFITDTTAEQHLYEIKTADQPWGPDQRALLAGLRAAFGSLDGHNVEFYRKILDRSKCRRKMLVYFTDGDIPSTNATEQRGIMRREAELCAKRGYSVLGVGIGSDAPKKYGLDTVRIDSSGDIVTVLRELEKRITRN